MSAPSIWDSVGEEFPRTGSWDEQARHCLRSALLAPSTHNVQPWLFRIGEHTIELRADRSRALAVSDPFDREMSISCGAALFNLRVALQRFGFRFEVETGPRLDDPDLLALVQVGGRATPSAEARLLFQAIPRRHTNRARFDPRPISPRAVRAFATAVGREGAWFVVLDGDDKLAAADLIAEGDRIQLGDPHFRRELRAWQAHGAGERRDGLTERGAGQFDVGEHGPLLVRTFDSTGHGRPAQDHELALGSPLLAVIGTRHEEVPAWIAAGQALQHLLLGATLSGVCASFLNQPVEVSSLRPRLAALTRRAGFPQLVVRLGHAAPARATPRRALDEVLLRDASFPGHEPER